MGIDSLITIALLGFVTSILGGMVGIGGAVILIPAFLIVPPLLGQQPLDMYTISGITSVQVLASSLLGAVLHSRRGAFDRRLVLTVGIPLMLSSFVGAKFSGAVSSRTLEVLFAIMAVIGAVLMLLRRDERDTIDYTLQYSRAIGIAVPVGLFGGMVGMAGGFLLSPLLVTVVKVPVRVTIGSTLGIVIIGAAAAAVGKMMAGMVEPRTTAAAIIGALPGMWLGVRISHRLHVKQLRMLLAFVIAAIGISMFVRVLL
ncbi:MAG: sulfite exporter TauE/SafE family protein [Chlorobi bacterium]|nr:sulfite exporter TauE/SafE family protein [Chlorobiota bacterium]